MAVKKNVQQNRKAFVQAKLGQTGVEATPEQRAKLRERFNTLSQTKEGRTKIAKALLPGGTAAERATLKKSIRPTQTGTGGSTTVTYNPGIGGNPKTTVVTGSTATKTPTGMGGNPITVTRTINNVDVPSNNSSSSAVIPTTLPQTTTTTTTVPQSNAFKSTGPSSTSSNGKDLTVPIVGGILVTGAAAVGSKAFLSSGTNIDRLTRVRQNDLARQFKASQLTSSSSLTLADRPQFASVKDQQAAAAAKTTTRPEFASVKDQRATAAAKTAAARPQFGSVADQRAAAAAKALAARPQFGSVASQRAAAAARTAPGATGGTRSVLEGMRSFMSGGLRKGAK